MQILCSNYRKFVNFLQFNTKVEIRGHWVWTEEKRGVIRCKIGVKRGSIDRHLISTDIRECPRGYYMQEFEVSIETMKLLFTYTNFRWRNLGWGVSLWFRKFSVIAPELNQHYFVIILKIIIMNNTLKYCNTSLCAVCLVCVWRDWL